MKTRHFMPLFLISCLAGFTITVGAATLPQGTTFVVKTNGSLSSRDSAGKAFQATLAQAVQVNGKSVLAAGTPVSGVVASPQVRAGSTTRPLSLKLTQISIGGRMAPIQTESLDVKETGVKSRGGVRVTGGAFLLTPGTTLQFRLSKPASW
jgi:hypothetical protein